MRDQTDQLWDEVRYAIVADEGEEHCFCGD
jgi:hypothetical protein